MSLVFPPVKDPELQQIIDIISMAVPDLRGLFFTGSGDPNTVVTASPPAFYLNRAGGAANVLWIKESGAQTNTGWIAK